MENYREDDGIGGWEIIQERLRIYQLFYPPNQNSYIWKQGNLRIDAIATYSSAITLVLYFGVSVLKIAKYKTAFKPELI